MAQTRVQVLLPDDLITALRAEAEESGHTLSSLIRYKLVKYEETREIIKKAAGAKK